MNITDIENKYIKISKNSITIKDKNNKTCGVIRNITHFHDIQENEKSIYYKLLKNAGLWCNNNININNIIISEGQVYILRDIHNLEIFRRIEPDNAKKIDDIYEIAEKNKIKVIKANLL